MFLKEITRYKKREKRFSKQRLYTLEEYYWVKITSRPVVLITEEHE